ncbi:hypothetical protein [Umezawaea sp. Da 62-37]|uniref:hypothetical protein n=1 Tax=Umezawaea sp. Da 62-37 TaxID=3075927 RepID=UPI0028F6D362|nr:hypothetical protein [Umezawaea sp. Da 62-37]WNV90328.1 hypothetical protein RM788_19215 [Umezawaea sp. Da 62-37]
MTSENSRARGTTVTIKYSGDRDAPWAVFYGTPDEIRIDVIAYFGLDSYAMEQRTLHELIGVASKVASGGPLPTPLPAMASAQSEEKALQLLKDELGARPIGETPAPAGDVWADAGTSAGSPPWDVPTTPAVNPMLARIEECANVQALKALWAQNQAAFADGSLMDAYKAKGRALKAAA